MRSNNDGINSTQIVINEPTARRRSTSMRAHSSMWLQEPRTFFHNPFVYRPMVSKPLSELFSICASSSSVTPTSGECCAINFSRCHGDHAPVDECPAVVSGSSRETSVTFGWLFH